MIKSEMDILAYILKDVENANKAMTHVDLVKALKRIEDKIKVLQASVGLSPENTKKLSERTIERRIAKYRRLLSKQKRDEYAYIQRMNQFKLNVSNLQDIVKEKDGVIAQLTFWLFVLIGLSVLIAAFVPGGGLLVKRFWSGAFKTAHIFGEKAYDALNKTVKGINTAMDKNKDLFDKKPEGSRQTLREIINDGIQQELGDDSKELFHDVQNGNNKLKEVREKYAAHLKKVNLNK